MADNFSVSDTTPDLAVAMAKDNANGTLLTLLGTRTTGGDVTYQTGNSLTVPRAERISSYLPRRRPWERATSTSTGELISSLQTPQTMTS